MRPRPRADLGPRRPTSPYARAPRRARRRVLRVEDRTVRPRPRDREGGLGGRGLVLLLAGAFAAGLAFAIDTVRVLAGALDAIDLPPRLRLRR